jgi:hypothetical protein
MVTNRKVNRRYRSLSDCASVMSVNKVVPFVEGLGGRVAMVQGTSGRVGERVPCRDIRPPGAT